MTEQLALKSEALTSLAVDWRKLLFPEANGKTFADGYAQAVTFGLLMARAKGIRLASDFETVARELSPTSSRIGLRSAPKRIAGKPPPPRRKLHPSQGSVPQSRSCSYDAPRIPAHA